MAANLEVFSICQWEVLGEKVTQRDCQTWIVESANQLVKDHMFSKETANYLCIIQQ